MFYSLIHPVTKDKRKGSSKKFKYYAIVSLMAIVGLAIGIIVLSVENGTSEEANVVNGQVSKVDIACLHEVM